MLIENSLDKLSKKDIELYNWFHSIIMQIIWGNEGFETTFNPNPGFTGDTSYNSSYKEDYLLPDLANYRNIYKLYCKTLVAVFGVRGMKQKQYKKRTY